MTLPAGFSAEGATGADRQAALGLTTVTNGDEVIIDEQPASAEAARRVETLREDGVKGGALPTLSAYLGKRAEAGGSLAAALREGDPARAAEARAACKGLAVRVALIPSSSRACEPNASWAIN